MANRNHGPLGTNLLTRRARGGVSRMRRVLGDDADQVVLFLWWISSCWIKKTNFHVVANAWRDGAGSALEAMYLKK